LLGVRAESGARRSDVADDDVRAAVRRVAASRDGAWGDEGGRAAVDPMGLMVGEGVIAAAGAHCSRRAAVCRAISFGGPTSTDGLPVHARRIYARTENKIGFFVSELRSVRS